MIGRKIDATIVVPTHDHGPLVEYAVRSALGQTVQSFELFIIGDGVPPEARRDVERVVQLDPRVRFFDFPKAGRTGEPHRNVALAEARGRIVCYLADDDLWLPRHLEQMLTLLDEADFAQALTLRVVPGDRSEVLVIDVAEPRFRELVLSGDSRIHLSSAGHTLAAFRRLDDGWRVTPDGIATDHYMWQSFLSRSDVRAVSGADATVLVFPSPLRRDWALADRLAEIREWARRLQNPDGARLVQARAFAAMSAAWLDAHHEGRERLRALERLHSDAAELQRQLHEKDRLIVELHGAAARLREARVERTPARLMRALFGRTAR